MLIAVVLLSLSPEPPNDGPVVVERAGFDCLAAAIARMPSDKTIYVDISRCPTVRIRNAYPWVPYPRMSSEPEQATPQRILRLDPAQSSCLRNNRRSLDRITRPIGKDRYIVDLATCRKP